MGTSQKVKRKGIFITGTDTCVGKTVASLTLGTLLKDQGYDVGFMKPVQCAGNDTEQVRAALDLKDTVQTINPYFAREPLSPNVAFERQNINVDIDHILETYQQLKENHDILIVEGAGGLLVPIKKDYLVADLIKDMDLDVLIVSRLGLGTINHTLLTVSQAREMGLNVKGVIFSQSSETNGGVPEATNPDVIAQYGDVKVLGTIPYLKNTWTDTILEQCKGKIDLSVLVKKPLDRTKQLVSSDKKYLWHPFTQMQDWLKEDPLIVDEAKGNYLIDTKGNRYLDGVSSLWVNVHGHRNRIIDRTIKDQINRLSHSTLLGLSNTPAVELAKELISIAPKGLKKVFYSDNGSTAVEIAIKIAYQYWQNVGKTKKTDIVHLANSYHGDTLGSVSVGGIDLFHKVYRKMIFKTIQLDFPDCYRAPKGKKYPEYAFEYLKKFEHMLKKKHNTIAAFVVEPIVQGAVGMIMWPKGVLKEMSRLCKKYDVIFIADEVATGFGRTGKMFACQQEGVVPDILCLAKGLTAGYLPLAATLTTQRIFDGFLHDYTAQKTFFHGHTYTGNPLACAAALANLKVFKKERTLAKLAPKIKYLSQRLKMFYNLSSVGDVRQRGFMVGIELVEDTTTKKPYSWEERIGVRVCQEVRKKGVIIRPLGNVIVLMPPLSMTKKELDQLLQATYWAIDQVTSK